MTLTCPRGHRWNFDVDRSSTESWRSSSCPVCGDSASSFDFGDETAPTAPTAIPLPEIDGYEIRGEAGRGGMGVVYQAWQPGLKRVVALKMIPDRDYARPETLGRFRAEAESLARLQHPNIVQVFHVGEQAGRPFLVMEFVEGGSLARKIAGTRPPARRAAEWVETLARAIEVCHQRGIIHRDLKPGNVLLTADETLKISDFGLAKRVDGEAGEALTATGDIFGTPNYMAPEQAGGVTKTIGPPADIYALGGILYEILTGRPPFRGESKWDTIKQVLTEEPVPPRRLQPNVPRDLETICLKCLEKEPRKRYASAAALADDLGRFLRGEPIVARPIPAWERVGKWVRRKPSAAALVAVSTLALTTLIVGGAWYNVRLRRALDRSERSQRQAIRAANVMVVDLAQGLKPIAGTQSTTVETILQSASKVYDDLSADAGAEPDPASLAGLGEAANALADIELEVNKTAEASASADRALALFRQLDRRSPGMPRTLAGLAEALEMRARVRIAQGDLPGSLRAFRESLAVRDRLAALEPDEPRWRAARAVSLLGIADVLIKQEALDEARSATDEAHAILEPLVASHPDRLDWKAALGRSDERLGDLLWTADKTQEAVAPYERAAQTDRDLIRKDPGNALWPRNLVRVLSSLGSTYNWNSDLSKAKAVWQEAVAIAERFTAIDPNNTVWLIESLRPRLLLSNVIMGEEGTDRETVAREQLAMLERVERLIQSLAEHDPTNAQWAARQASMRLQIGAIYLQMGMRGVNPESSLNRALEALRTARSMQQALAAKDPTNATWASAVKGTQSLIDETLKLQKSETVNQ